MGMTEETKMNPEIKARWVAALRGGEYTQGKSSLRNKYDELCCLGVLCDLAGKDGLGEWTTQEGSVHLFFDGCYLALPQSVVDWAGLDSHNPTIYTTEEGVELSDYNDGGLSFAALADLIELHL